MKKFTLSFMLFVMAACVLFTASAISEHPETILIYNQKYTPLGYIAPDDTVVVSESLDELVEAEDSVMVIDEYNVEHSPSVLAFTEKGKPYPLENLADDIEASDYRKILKNADEVLKVRPDDFNGLMARIVALYGLGDHKGASELSARIMSLYPYEKPASDMAEYFMQVCTDDFISAMETLEPRVLADNSYDDDFKRNVIANYAYMLYDANRFGRSIKEYMRAKQYTDDPDTYLLDLVVLHMLDGQPAKSIELLETIPVERRDEQWNDIYSGYLRLAKGPQATIDFIGRKPIEKFEHEDYISMMLNYALLGRNDKVREYGALARKASLADLKDNYSRLYDRYPMLKDVPPESLQEIYNSECNDVDMRMGISEWYNGDKEKARKIFEDFIAKGADPSPGYVVMAKAFLGDKEAVDEYCNNMDNIGDFAVSLYNVLGETDIALDSLKRAYERGETTPLKVRYDILQRSLLDAPRYPQIEKSYQPDR